MKKFILGLFFSFMSLPAFSQTYIIEPGSSPSKRDLEMRVFRLEQAVAELQNKVYQLERTIPAHDNGPVPSHKKWFCEITSFMDRFSSYGVTELEARQAVLAKCSDKFGNEFNCKKISCQLNK